MSDLAAQINAHFRCDGSVIVTQRAAEWLERRLGLTQDRRLLLRDNGDHELYAVLTALHIAAMGGDQLAARSANGTNDAECQDDTADSETWLTTAEAAAMTGRTDRAIRKACAAQRLPARRHGGRWLINRQHLVIAQALAA